MKKVNKCLSFILLPLIISATLAISIKADEKESPVYDSVKLNLDENKFEEESIHHFCFVKSGDYAEIRFVHIIKGFWLAYYTDFDFCMGDVELYSKGELIVKNLFGKTTYENVHVSMTGFIGIIRQKGIFDYGYLRGFARSINITMP